MGYPFGQIHSAATSKPLAVTYDATISSSTSLTLNTATTGIEVTAIDKPIFLKFDANASTTVFDGIIAPNTTKAFMIPRGTVTANFIEQSSAAILVCIEF